MSCTRRHGGSRALLAALLACALAAATAQQPPGSDSGQDQVSTAMVALLAAVVAVFVFIAASTVYLRHCSGRYDDAVASSGRSPADGAGRGLDDGALFSSRSWWQRRRRRRVARGLDAEAVEAFPTMTYAKAKALRVGTKGGGGALECAVCLSEFEDGDRLRLLLPRCSHAFHPDCIDEWLAGHVTCPVCRCNLEPSGQQKDPTSSSSSDGETAAATIPFASSVSSETAAAVWRDGGGTVPVAVVIDVVTEEEEEEDRRQEAVELHRIGSRRRAMGSRSQLARWHSTGNSLAARLDRDLERFTLRLPEHVRREMVAAASEHSMQLRRSAPLGRSGGWQSILGGTFSGRLAFFSASRMAPSSGDGEVSSSSSYSYSRLRGRRVAALPVNVADVVPVGDGSTCLDRDGVGAASIEVAAAPPDEENAAKQ